MTRAPSLGCGAALTAASLLACLAPAGAGERSKEERVVPLRHAHAHNDYEHKRPLLDALAHGFCSVEADVFLVDGELLVGHERKDLRPGCTLEKLYLDPLRQRARANGGRVYRGGPTVFLLVDVKSEAKPTYAALDRVLARYDDLLSVTRDGRSREGAVTVVVSGNCDREAIMHGVRTVNSGFRDRNYRYRRKKCPAVDSLGVAQSPKSSSSGTMKSYALNFSKQVEYRKKPEFLPSPELGITPSTPTT
jgi:hypothetical protein